MCSQICTLIHLRQMQRGTSRAQQQVPQLFHCTHANGSLFTPPIDLIRFTLYGADSVENARILA